MRNKFVLAQRSLSVVLMVWLLMSSCSKKNDVVDPRDAYVGTWVLSSVVINGASQTVTPDEIIIEKASAQTDITIKNFFSDDLPATANGSGYIATNANINTGQITTFADKSTATVFLQNLTATTAGSQLTITYTFAAQSSTTKGTASVVETYTKK